MRDFRFSQRSLNALIGVHPDLVLVATAGLNYSPLDFMVTEGVRSKERQEALFLQGFSRVRSGGAHELHPDGFGYAIDVMAVGDLNDDGVRDHRDTALTWDPASYGAIAFAMKRAARELGVLVRWGGDFKLKNGEPFFDGPHFELEA